MDLKNARTYINHEDDLQKPSHHTQKKDVIVYVIFIIVFLLEGVAFNVFLHRAIMHSAWSTMAVVGVVIIASFLFYSLFPLRYLWQIFTVMIFFMPIIVMSFGWMIVVVAIVSTILFVATFIKIRHMLDNMRKIDIGVVMRSGAHGIFFALLVMSSVYYYVLISSQRIDDLLPRADRLTFVRSAMERYVIKNSGGGVLTIDHFLEGVITRQLEATAHKQSNERYVTIGEKKVLGQESLVGFLQKITTPALQQNIDHITATMQKNIIAQTRKNLSDTIGEQLTGKEDVLDVMILFTRAQIKNAITQNPAIAAAFPKILTAVFFFTVLSLGIFFRFCAYLLARMMFVLAKNVGALFITRTEDTVEHITLREKTTT